MKRHIFEVILSQKKGQSVVRIAGFNKITR